MMANELDGEVSMGFALPFIFIFGTAWLLINAWVLHRAQRKAADAYFNSANKCLEQIAKSREYEEFLKKEMARIEFYAKYGVDKSGSSRIQYKINSYPSAYASAMSRSK